MFIFVSSLHNKYAVDDTSYIENYSGEYKILTKEEGSFGDILVLESNEDGTRVSVFLPHEQAVLYFEGETLSCSFTKDRRKWQVTDFTVSRVIKEKIEQHFHFYFTYIPYKDKYL